jgi:hypothetical protein
LGKRDGHGGSKSRQRNIAAPAPLIIIVQPENPEENIMKTETLVLAAAFALSGTLAFAQAGTGSGATVPEKPGVVVNDGGAVVGTTNEAATPKRGTAGVAPAAKDASNQGAPTAGSAEKMGSAPSPGSTMKK